ncbi:MAG: glycosyltransferase family 2 protein [Anaerolineae bacterium]|nr:glycosyltransferase family 2 protein [Anaerolineae bacterium]
MKVLALIPAYNEAGHIARVVHQASEHLPVLVVDDGSTDSTASLAREAGATVVRQTPNQGKGVALRAGFRYALDNEWDAVVMLDADEQHDPAEIPLFLRAYAERGADMIIGARTFGQMPLVRRVANSIGTALISWAVGQHIPDDQSGYRMVTRRLMQATLDSQEKGFHFEVDMIVTCVLEGLAIDWVPIRTIYAGESSHIRPLRHALTYLSMVWRARRRVRRHLRG